MKFQTIEGLHNLCVICVIMRHKETVPKLLYCTVGRGQHIHVQHPWLQGKGCVEGLRGRLSFCRTSRAGGTDWSVVWYLLQMLHRTLRRQSVVMCWIIAAQGQRFRKATPYSESETARQKLKMKVELCTVASSTLIAGISQSGSPLGKDMTMMVSPTSVFGFDLFIHIPVLRIFT